MHNYWKNIWGVKDSNNTEDILNNIKESTHNYIIQDKYKIEKKKKRKRSLIKLEIGMFRDQTWSKDFG